MQIFTLYRGITVPSANAEIVIENIRANGFSGTEGKWNFSSPDILRIRQNLELLFHKEDLTADNIFLDSSSSSVCACGEDVGAAYYAIKHNYTLGENDYPIVIEFTTSVEDLYVDSHDFLCTAFQFWDRDSSSNQISQKSILVELFGSKISRYFSAACESNNQKYRIGMCNLASFDPDIVQAHYANRKIIRGRYGTSFSSAFFVKAPVEASRIQRVYSPEIYTPENEYIELSKFIAGVWA